MQSEGWYQAFTGIHAWHGLKPRYSGGAFLLDTCRGKLGQLGGATTLIRADGAATVKASTLTRAHGGPLSYSTYT